MRKKNKQKDLARSEHLANRSSQVFIPSLSPEEQRTFPGPWNGGTTKGLGSQGEEAEASVLTIYGIVGWAFWALEAPGCNGNKPVENQIR